MNFEKSSIEKLKRTLYSRDENVVPKEHRTPVSPQESDVPKDWGEAPSFGISYEDMSKSKNSFFNKFLLGSFLFFTIALGIAGFVFFGGLNMISSNNVDVQITAPSSVASGELLSTLISVVNKNPTNMENVSLFIAYPQGVSSADATGTAAMHDKIDLDVIAKGKSKDYTIRTVLFGEKDVIKTFSLRLEYTVTGSNATFSKEKTFDIVLGSSPLLLNVSAPTEINSGEPFTISLDITSNSSTVMKNTLVKVEYPYGFTYKDSNIKPLSGTSVWNIGDLKGGDKKMLTIVGTLVGQDLEDRSFRISSGTGVSSIAKDFDITLATSLLTVGIRKSFFDLSLVSNENNVALLGQYAPVYIKWTNTLPDKIVNSRIEASFTSAILDKSRVSQSNGGFYRSGDNTILWDKNTTNNLISLSPGDSGQVLFNLATIATPAQIKTLRNPHIDIHAVITGERSGVDTATISSSADTTIKIASNLTLTSKTYRNTGSLQNIGPIPPKADKETTYTVTWTLTNTTNDVSGATVTATLPTGVMWKAETAPVSERISFNPDTRLVSWNVGNVAAGVGFVNSAKEVSFKVSVTPSVSQIGASLVLVSQATASATDTYATVPLTTGANPVTTAFSDSGFRSGQDIVVK